MIRPRDVYTVSTKESVLRDTRRLGYRVVGFREVRPGDLYFATNALWVYKVINSDIGAFRVCVVASVSDDGKGYIGNTGFTKPPVTPVLILEPLREEI